MNTSYPPQAQAADSGNPNAGKKNKKKKVKRRAQPLFNRVGAIVNRDETNEKLGAITRSSEYGKKQLTESFDSLPSPTKLEVSDFDFGFKP
jgi:hypothetical protein